MITFKEFLIREGGNFAVGDIEADRIDLNKISRKEIVPVLKQSLTQISIAFEKFSGFPLWSNELLKSNEYLSGSAFHFFDTSSRDDDTFKSVKPSVGDIDTQVDGTLEPKLKNFLDSLSTTKFGDLTFVGFKKSAGQFITLWTSTKFKINIQIDLELVDYHNGKPTPWSQFSHSSEWSDMEEGIKGVAHKYMLRALDAKNLKDVIVLSGKKRVPKVIKATELAFSVQNGLRIKLAPVLDDSGNHVNENGLLVYNEIPSSESNYIKDIRVMFELFFGKIPTANEVKQFSSFVGLVDLCKKYNTQSDNHKILSGFVNTLWGKGAQSLYRDDKLKDFKEKKIMFEYIATKFNSSIDVYQTDIDVYYKGG